MIYYVKLTFDLCMQNILLYAQKKYWTSFHLFQYSDDQNLLIKSQLKKLQKQNVFFFF